MPVIVRRMPFGRQAQVISAAELDGLLASGAARRVSGGGCIYEETPDAVQTEPPKKAAEAQMTQEYQTKVMVAAKPKRAAAQKKVKHETS
jgi:hypothetical protein